MDETLKPAAARALSPKGLALIKAHEGLRLTSYVCPAGVWTVGWGHTATAAKGQTITQAQAESLLARDLAVKEEAVRRLVKAEITQGQYDALVSFAFNLGERRLKNSSLLRLVNAGDVQRAANQFDRWVFAGGKRLPGLARRRAEERALFEGRG